MPRWATVRSRNRGLGLLAAAGMLVAACSVTDARAVSPPASPSATVPAAGPTGSGAPVGRVVDAANGFLRTLDTPRRDAVLLGWDDEAQKHRWSDLPAAAFARAGLRWGDLAPAQQDAWLAVMRTSLSPEGYGRVLAAWAADDAQATRARRPDVFGRQHYRVALFGTPSATAPWMWQFGGHHLAINATVARGRISVTPSFIGAQPAGYPDAAGRTVRPLGDVEDEALTLVNSLSADQRAVAVLGDAPVDLALGPGRAGVALAPVGLRLSAMTTDQQAAALRLVAHYTGLVDDADAAAQLDEVRVAMAQTYFAWYGPTILTVPAYFRFSGPTVVIEYAPQTRGGPPAEQIGATAGDAGGDHVHSVYRNPVDDYGARIVR